MLQSCLGLSIDAVEGRVNVSHARLPAFLEQVTVSGLTVGDGRSVNLLFDRNGRDVGVTVLDRAGEVGGHRHDLRQAADQRGLMATSKNLCRNQKLRRPPSILESF